MSLMPGWARRMTGFDTPGRRAGASCTTPSLHAYARTLRWAFGTPEYRRLAEERAALRPQEVAYAA